MENQRKHSLGHRAFFLFLSKRIRLALFLFVLTAAVWWSGRWMPIAYLNWQVYVEKVLLLVSGAYFLVMLLLAYWEYRVYTYMFTDEAFVMTSGSMVRDEVTALYHQIQNVNIHRTLRDRMVGVSQVVIYMAGGDKGAGHTQIVLPAVTKAKARAVQKELLSRAHRHVSVRADMGMNVDLRDPFAHG